MKDSILSKRDSVTTDRPEPFLDADEEFFAQVVILQDGLVAWATGKPFEEATYRRCRSQLLARHDLLHLVPPFVRNAGISRSSGVGSRRRSPPMPNAVA